MQSLTVNQTDRTKEIIGAVLDDLSPTSRSVYKQAIKEFFMFAAYRKDTNPYQDPFTVLLAYKAWLRDEVKPSTANRKMSAVRRFYELAAASGLVSYEQYVSVKAIRNVPGSTPYRTWLSKTEMTALYNAPDNSVMGQRDRVLLLLLLLGLRRFEAVSLQWDNIHTVDDAIMLDVAGKGGRQRTVVVPERYHEVLETWKQYSSEGWVLGDVRNGVVGKQLSVRAVNKIVGKYAKRVGVEATPHTLRRSVATLVYMQSGKVDTVRALLGHTTEATTRQYLKEAVTLVENAAKHIDF